MSAIQLKVAEAKQQRDVGRSIARIDSETIKSLGVTVGDIIKITGKKETAAKAWPAYPEDQGLGLLRIDGLPLHGLLHTFLGGTFVALLLALVMKRMNGFTASLTSLIGLGQRPRPRNIYAAALSGVYLYILLDSRLYTDIRPFYPFAFNLFLDGMGAAFEIWWFCVVTGLIGAALLVFRLIRAQADSIISFFLICGMLVSAFTPLPRET